MGEGGPGETVLKTPYPHLGEPEASAQRNGSIRLQSLLALPVSAPRKLTRGTPLDSLPVLLWFELPVFALEIIDLASHVRHLILQIFHVLVDLLQLEQHVTRPLLEGIAIGLLLQDLLNLP